MKESSYNYKMDLDREMLVQKSLFPGGYHKKLTVSLYLLLRLPSGVRAVTLYLLVLMC